MLTRRTLAAAFAFASGYLRAVGLGLGFIAAALRDELDREQHREPAAPAREDGEPLDLDAVRAFYGPRGVPRARVDSSPVRVADMRAAFARIRDRERAAADLREFRCIDPDCPICRPRLNDQFN